MSSQLEFKKLREFGEIINDTFVFIRQNLKALLKTFIYFCGFFVVIAAIAAVLQQLGLRKVLTSWETPGARPADFFNGFGEMFNLNYLILVLFGVANYAAMNVAILSFVSLYVEKGNVTPTIEQVWSYFKYYFLRALGSSFCISIFLLFCFALCLLPGIYVFPAMSLFFPVMIFENGSLVYSFGRTFKLLKDQWWLTAATVLILFVITYACVSFVSMPVALITMVGTFTQGAKGLSDTMVIVSTVLQYLCQVFMIVPIVGLSLIYFNLAERRENSGLMSRIDQFGQSKNPFGTPEQY
jgi:hypothetical protein